MPLVSGRFGRRLFTWMAAALLPATTFATEVVLGGAPHILIPHPRVWFDGPGGTITASLCHDRRNRVCKAVASNPIWGALTSSLDEFVANVSDCPDGKACSYQWQNAYRGMRISSFAQISLAALAWYSDRSKRNYLDLVKYWLNHADETVETLACDERIPNCGNNVDNDYASRYVLALAMAYTLVRNELDGAARARFLGMMLNDLTDEPRCEDLYVPGPGAVTTSVRNDRVTGIGTRWLSENDPGKRLRPGDTIYIRNDPHRILSVDSDVSLTYRTQNMSYFQPYTAVAYKVAHPWKQGNCGFVYYLKHNLYSSVSTPPILRNSPYLPSGGSDAWLPQDVLHNQVLTRNLSLLAIALATADDDPRASRLLDQLYGWWVSAEGYTRFKKNWSGFAPVDSRYFTSRYHPFMQDMVWLWDTNFTKPLVPGGYGAGQWLKNSLMTYVYSELPNAREYFRYGDQYATAQVTMDQVVGLLTGIHAYAGSDEAKYANDWLRRLSGLWSMVGPSGGFRAANGFALPWEYTFLNPLDETLDTTKLPAQRAFTGNDFDGPQGFGPGMVISRTGWTDPLDTAILIQAIGTDTLNNLGGCNPASFKIYKGTYLIGEDSAGSTNSRTGVGEAMNYMEIGGQNQLISPRGTPATTADVRVPRYAGDPQSRYTYALVDSRGAYRPAASVIRLQRQFVHFKKPTARDYLVIYDDAETAAGNLKRIYTHYSNNGQLSEGATTLDANTATVVSNGPNARLRTRFLLPAGPKTGYVYTDAPNGSYPGGAGSTFRVSVCASADGKSCDPSNRSAEFLTVHMPEGLKQPPTSEVELIQTIDPRFSGVQIGGVAPKVAIFARGGMSRPALTFAVNFAGQAQVLIAGLLPGAYDVQRNGTELLHNAAVQADAGTLYFEAEAGLFAINRH
jgi:hypothetical protein